MTEHAHYIIFGNTSHFSPQSFNIACPAASSYEFIGEVPLLRSQPHWTALPQSCPQLLLPLCHSPSRPGLCHFRLGHWVAALDPWVPRSVVVAVSTPSLCWGPPQISVLHPTSPPPVSCVGGPHVCENPVHPPSALGMTPDLSCLEPLPAAKWGPLRNSSRRPSDLVPVVVLGLDSGPELACPVVNGLFGRYPGEPGPVVSADVD